jgi:glutamine synthetase
MHFHVSLWAGEGEDRCCVFSNPASDSGPGLSPLALQFIAGVLQHSAALSALAAPTVNSYKRLVVGETLSGTSWAPACVAHGPNNRTALVRTLPGRFEWRLPDASANPYLATAAMIAAGLDGIERRLDPGPACCDDLFACPPAEIRARGIAMLPQSLGEAVDALEASALLRSALGATLHGEFVRLKRAEHSEHARHVSAWELDRYATRF